MTLKTTKIASLFIAWLAVLLFIPVVTAQAAATWTPRYVGTTVNGYTAPSGYYEYLPTSYNSGSPLSSYSLVIFMHGSGQYGDGTATGSPGLSNNLTDGLCKMINNNTSPVAQTGGTFDTNNVIVLCPQCTNPYPISDSAWRAFFNFAMNAYPKIDKRRIWFTGLSYGSTAVTQAMDNTVDPSPDDAAAVVACAWRGDDFTTSSIAAIGKLVPLWILTSQGDTSSNPDLCVDNLAAAIKGSTANDGPGIFPSGSFTQPYTAYFNGTSWTLSSLQIDPITGVNPKITYWTGSDHNSWDRTYGNTNVWNWLFQQQKPNVSISSPSGTTIAAQGSNVTFTGSATDKNGTSLTGSSLQWIDSINGSLGTGASITVNNLSIGAHIVKLQATDNSYRDNKATVNVTVPYTGAFTSQFDFGDPSETTTSTGWNNITSTTGSVTNAVNSSGTAIGVNVTIGSPFVGINTAGVVDSTLYPSTAQEDTIYIGGAGSAQTGTVVVSGLNPAETYNFTFFASRSASDDRTSTYTIGTSTVSLNAANNTSNTVSLNSISPDSGGQVTITVGHGTSATYGYLGVMVITTSGASTAPVFTDGPPPSTGTVGTSYSFTYTASGTPSPTFTLNSGTLPPGLSLASNGVLSGTPTTGGVYSGISVKATNSNGNATTSAFTITINSVPTISGGSSTNIATSGTAILGYNTGTLTSTGTSIAHAGVTTSINDGVGTSHVDTFGNSGSYGYVGITYSSAISSTVGSLQLVMHPFVDGGWFGPNNVSAQGVTGGATGGNLVAAALTAPTVQTTTDGTTWSTASSTNNYVSQMTGAAANNSAAPTVTFTLNTPVTGIKGIRLIGTNGGTASSTGYPGFIGVNQLQVLTTAMPTGTTGTAYSFSYTLTGTPTPTCTVTAGSLPPGLTISSGGTISGTPTTAGTYTGTVTASNSTGSATAGFNITINSGTPTTVVAIDCGGTSSYTAADGTVYSADTYYSAGGFFNAGVGTTSGSDPNLYQYYRYGTAPYSYVIPIANGTYTVHLKYAEMNQYQVVGGRVFNVAIQGTTVASNFDITALVGTLTPLDEAYSATVTGGTLTITFSNVTANSEIAAIKVTSP